MDVLRNIGVGFSDLLLTLLATLLLVRALLHASNADPGHPLIRTILAFTNAVLAWPHRFLPPRRRMDPACWLAAFLVCALEIQLRVALVGGAFFDPIFFWFALLELLKLTLYIFVVAVLVTAVAGWFMPPYQMVVNPLLSLLRLLVEPLLAPIRRAVPPFGAVDISPMVLLLLIYLALIVLGSL